jgi:phage-related minor tail protein
MSLRDLVVSVDFDDININRLFQVDTAMDAIEDQFRNMGGLISDAGRDFNRLGSSGGNALNEIRNEAETAGSALSEVQNDATDVGDALDQLGNDGRSAGADITNGLSDAQDSLRDTANQAEQAGDAINQLESTNLNNLNNQINNGVFSQRNFNDAAGQGNKILGLLKTAGVAAFAAIAAGAAAVAVAVGLIVTESETAFDRLQAKTGTVGQDFEGLKQVATDVFNNGMGESLTMVTDDVATMRAMFKGLNDEELAGLTKNAYTIKDLWGPEVKEVSKTVKTMTATFKDLSNADAMDLMTTAFQKTGDYSDDLLDTFNEYSVYFQKLGFDAKGFTNVLIKGAEAGAFTMDKAADAIKEFGIRSIDASEATADGFKLIGLDAKKMTENFAAGGDTAQQAFAATVAGLANMKDPIKQNAAGVALFGTQWEDLRETVVLAMSDGRDAVGDFKGATQEAANTAYDNFGTKMLKTFRTLQTTIAEAFIDNGGAELLDGIAAAAEKMIPKVESMVGKAIDFANAVQDNWPAIRETLIGITVAVGSFAAMMATLSIIKTVTTFINLWRTANLTAALSMLGLNMAIWANPITWLVAGIAAAIAIGVLLYRNWDTVTEKAGELWAKIIELKDGAVGALAVKFGEFKDVMSDVKDKFIEFKDQAIQVTKDKIDEFKQTLEDNKGTITTVAAVLATIFGPALLGVAAQATITAATVTGQFIASLIRTAAQAVITGASVTASFIGSLIVSSAQAIATGAVITAQFIGSLIRTAAQAAITGGALTISLIGTMIRMAAQAVITGATMTVSMIGSLIRFAAQGWVTLASMAAVTGGMLIQKGAMIASAAVTATVTAAQWALNVALNANPIGLVVIAIGALIAIGVLLYKNWDKIKAGAAQLWETISSKFSGIKESISNAIQPVLGWFDSLKDKWDSFKKSISNFKMPSIKIPFFGGKDGSHATGLARVPFDGYMAELHKDEAVLTASQSDALRRTGILDNAGSKPKLALESPEITNKINIPMDDPNNGGFDPRDQPQKQPQIAGGSKETTTNINTFSPQITIQVEGGKDGQVDHGAIAQAVKKEMEKFWMQMNLQNA